MNGQDILHELVSTLESEWGVEKQIQILQRINAQLLTQYEIRISDEEVIYPLRVEAYYYPYRTREKFNDPCAHPSSKKLGAFGKLYFIESRYGYPGVDLCLSQGDYYLSFLIKNSRIGDEFFKQVDLFDRFHDRQQEIEEAVNLRKRAVPLTNLPVFNTSRVGLKEKNTGFAHKLLASVIMLQYKYDWEKSYGKEWTVANYLAEHHLPPDDAEIEALLGYRSEEVKRVYTERMK